MVLIGNSRQAVWGSDFSVVKEEEDLTLKEDFSSFKMAVQTDQLLQIKEATNAKNSHPREHEADVYWNENMLVQLLKKFQYISTGCTRWA